MSIISDGTVPDEMTTVESYVLEQVALSCSQWFDGHALANMSIQKLGDELTRNFVFHLNTYVLGEKVHEVQQEVTFRYPANWWEHLKYEHAPVWLVSRWPVRWKHKRKTVTFEQVECLPKFASVLPTHQQQYHFPVLKTAIRWTPETFPDRFVAL